MSVDLILNVNTDWLIVHGITLSKTVGKCVGVQDVGGSKRWNRVVNIWKYGGSYSST